jgi:hypothetical protein
MRLATRDGMITSSVEEYPLVAAKRGAIRTTNGNGIATANLAYSNHGVTLRRSRP